MERDLRQGWGLKVNLAKSRLISVEVSISNVGTMAASLGCSHDSLPFIYLGLPVGVGCLLAKNLGLLGKWKWRFLTEDKAMWNLVIKEFYRADGGFNSPPNQIGAGGIWPEIIKVVKCIEAPLLKILLSGKIIDRWQLVNNVWGGNWSWRFPPRGRAIDDLASITSYIGIFNLTVD
ncbi:hypothetical protein Tco_1575626 [Tanacetum coccineum]